MNDSIFSVSEGDVSYQILLPDSEEDYIQKRIRETGAPYEVGMLRDMASRLSSTDTVLDIGANVGNHALYLARLVGCRVIAFEPNAHLALAITVSADLNGLSDLVEVHNVGVGSQPGIAHFQREMRGNMGAQALELGGGDIRVIALDKLKLKDPVRAIKVDVEGFELQVLKGAQAIIARDRPIIYAECIDEQQFTSVSNWLADYDYAVCEQFNATPTHLFTPIEQVDLPTYVRNVVGKKTIDLYRSQSDLTAAKKSLSLANERYQNAGRQINDLKSRVADDRVRVSGLIAENDKLKGWVADERARVSGLIAENDKLKSRIIDEQARVSGLIAENDKLKGWVTDERARVSGLITENDKLKGTVALLEGKSMQVGSALDAERRDRAQLQTRVRQLERENDGIRRSYQAVRAKLIAVQKSRTFRTGVAIREGLNSPRGFLALPIRLLRVMRSPTVEISAVPESNLRGNHASTPTPEPKVVTPTGITVAPVLKIKATLKPLNNLAELARNQDFVIISGAYPSLAGNYGGEFVRSRAESYVKSGLAGLIIELNQRNTNPALDYDGPLPVLRAHPTHLDDIIAVLVPGRAAVLTHSPTPDMQAALIRALPGRRLLFWFHGFELRDYRRLFYNFDTPERERRRASLDLINQQRWEAARESFSAPGLTTIFVSNFLVRIATRDVGRAPTNAQVIPNFIDGDFFRPTSRDASAARHILLIRPFKARNYAYDIAVEAISILSSRTGFSELFFTLRGFGENFASTTAVLANLPNVTLEERYSTPEEMRDLHARHGIALCPTRHDTQGVSLGEAMASGLACITHDVAAIPEFTDENCAVLVRPDDPQAYAEAIWALAHDPDRVQRLGAAAAQRVRLQCGPDQTVRREEDLIRSAASKDARHVP